MIDVLLTVGIYHTEKDIKAQAIPFRLPELPKNGDTIILNDRLKAFVDEKTKDWDTDKDCPTNYVNAIGWLNEMPVVMLHTNPRRIKVDCFYNDKVIHTCLQVLPNINDRIGFSNDSFSSEWLYINGIYHLRGSVFLFLGDSPVSRPMTLDNESIDVNVLNNVQAEVNNIVDVNINRCYTTLDVKNY